LFVWIKTRIAKPVKVSGAVRLLKKSTNNKGILLVRRSAFIRIKMAPERRIDFCCDPAVFAMWPAIKRPEIY
jgi:hypothetical protein